MKTEIETAAATATATATAKPARKRKLRLLVDNLRHIYDHGIAVDFTDPALQEWVASMTPDGTYRFEAGKSHITVWRLGRVTRVKLFLSHGSYTLTSVNYYDQPAGLKYSVKGAEEVQALSFLIFGEGKMPRGMTKTTSTSAPGEHEDSSRKWLNEHRWTLLGEAGLRAQAVAARVSILQQDVSVARAELGQCNLAVDSFAKRDFAVELSNLNQAYRRRVANEVTSPAEKYGEVLERLRHVESFDDPEAVSKGISDTYSTLGLNREYGVRPSGEWGYAYTFPGTRAQINYAMVNPNYKVTLGEDGETLLLNSGIRCEVTKTQALEWLRNNGVPPLRTSYGLCHIDDVCDFDRRPYRVVRVGCHRLDLASDLGGEFAELLKPTHKVEFIPGTPALPVSEASREEVMARLQTKMQQLLEGYRNTRERLLQAVTADRKRVKNTRDNKELHLEDLKRQQQVCHEHHEKAKALLSEGEARFDGIRLSQVNAAAAAFVNLLVPSAYTPAK